MSIDEDEDDDEDEPVVATPARRKRIATSDEKNPETPKRDSDQDKLDIEADLEDLQDSGMSTCW